MIMTSGTLGPAFPDAYSDPNITFRNPRDNPVTVDHVTNAAHGIQDGPSYAEIVDGSNFAPDNPPDTLPKATTSWVLGRDPYTNGGSVGQSFFNNSGS